MLCNSNSGTTYITCGIIIHIVIYLLQDVVSTSESELLIEILRLCAKLLEHARRNQSPMIREPLNQPFNGGS